MAAVNSIMQALGGAAPKFSLPDVSNNNVLCDISQFTGRPLLVMFICNHCPYVIHVMSVLSQLANQTQRDGFAVVAISSNDVLNYPQDAPPEMTKFAEHYNFEFPYLYDESQQVAKDYGAACTPDFFVYDAEHRLCYRGQMDGSRPGNSTAVSGNDLSAAVAALSAGRAISQQQIPSVGCNIKWSAGNEPDYF